MGNRTEVGPRFCQAEGIGVKLGARCDRRGAHGSDRHQIVAKPPTERGGKSPGNVRSHTGPWELPGWAK